MFASGAPANVIEQNRARTTSDVWIFQCRHGSIGYGGHVIAIIDDQRTDHAARLRGKETVTMLGWNVVQKAATAYE